MNNSNLMDNILSWGLNKVVETAVNNPDQISKFVSDFAMNNSTVRSFLKSMNWSASGFSNLVQKSVTGLLAEFKNREPFSVSDEDRVNKFSEVYPELLGYNCLSNIEARILAAGLSQFNGKEIQKMFKLENQMSVEQIQSIAEEAHKKYMDAASKANVGVTSTTVERSSEIDLSAIADNIERNG